MRSVPDSRGFFYSFNVAHERPSKRAKPACEGPSRWAGWTTTCESLFGDELDIDGGYLAGKVVREPPYESFQQLPFLVWVGAGNRG